ncbi:hypothetical protein [Verrucomicrobium spinosum]|uniref:hypothetical protein n=1 Tax=Verrucomicrobium spinosum TaxID=2736 RepID=UPI002108FEBB|nr:hypothetical protein [Verrucomicrobium spinosum]
MATASGLFVAIPAFTAYYWLRNRAARVLHDLQDTVSQLMRKMPYDKLAGAHIGDEEIVAADPEWWVESEPVEADDASDLVDRNHNPVTPVPIWQAEVAAERASRNFKSPR